MLDPKFVIVGSLLNLTGAISYCYLTIKGKTKPNRVTWFLWALAPMIAFVAELGEGVGLRSLMTFSVGFGPTLVLLASFVNSKSVWKLTTFDYTCGGLSVLGLMLWLITRQGNLAIFLAIASDALAAVPTVVKVFKDPESESAGIFGLSSISALIAISTIDQWNFANYAFPLYIFTLCFLIFVIVKLRLGKRIAAEELEESKVF